MESLLLVLGVLGNAMSVLVFASPIKTFWRIARSGSTEAFESAPYVVTLLNCSLWFYYGITKPGGFLIATVNGVGIVLEAVYVTLFLIFATPQRRAKTAILVGTLDVGFFGAVVLVTRLAMHGSLRTMVIGAICACLNVFRYGSPLAAMRTVITTRSVESMPFFLSLSLVLNGGIWTIYAVLDKDIFVGITNGIGFILGIIQLSLYRIYMNVHEELQDQQLIQPNNVHQNDDETKF